MAGLPDPVAQLASVQHGAVARWQVRRRLGYSSAEADHWLRAGHLAPARLGSTRVTGVFTAPGAPTTPAQQVAVAVLRAGPGARVAGASACGLYGLEGFPLPGDIAVTVPPTRRVRAKGFTVTYRAVPSADRAVVLDLPAVTPTRALIEAAAKVDERTLRVALDDARRRGLVTLDRLRRRAEDLGSMRGAAAVRRLLGSTAARHESEGERSLAGLFHGPYPQPQYQVELVRGIRVDAVFLEARLVLEYDGGDHHSIDTDRDADSRRELRLKALGFEVIRVTRGMLRDEPEATRDRILAIRAQRMAALRTT